MTLKFRFRSERTAVQTAALFLQMQQNEAEITDTRLHDFFVKLSRGSDLLDEDTGNPDAPLPVILKDAAPDLLEALLLLNGYVEDLQKSNPGYLGKLCLQNYAQMNMAFLKTDAVLARLKDIIETDCKHPA